MVTWGQNQTFTLPAAGSSSSTGGGFGTFGSPATPAAPATPGGGGFSFGPAATSAPTATGGGLFGSAPAGGSLFGTATTSAAAAPSSAGLFGQTAPAAPGGNAFSFGSSPAPATPGGGGLFGVSSGGFGAAPVGGGLFGTQQQQSTGGSLFGQPSFLQQQQAPPQPPQIPAQAALQAQLNAEARIEEDRVQSHLQRLNNAYTYTAPAKSELESSDFCEIVYNPVTPEYQQQQWLHGLGVDGRPRLVLPPNKPAQVAQREWEHAAVRNPDRQQFMPIALIGATALQARLTGQQEQVNVTLQQLATLKAAHDVTRNRYERARDNLKTMAMVHDQQQKRLLDLMRRVEVQRCYNNALQPDEVKAMQKAVDLYRQVERLTAGVRAVEEQAQQRTTTALTLSSSRPASSSAVISIDVPDKEQLKAVLKEHRAELAKCTTMVDKDMRDLHLISQRVKSLSGGELQR
jgi:Nucleoporin complex subunit 54/Nucleoporin FG repeat region